MRNVKKGNPAATVTISFHQNATLTVNHAADVMTYFVIIIVIVGNRLIVFAQVHLQYDKLYVDGKCFVWNDHRGKVTNHDDDLTMVMIILLIVDIHDDAMQS